MTIEFAEKFRAAGYWVNYFAERPEEFPLLRPLNIRSVRGLEFNKHYSYADAAVITAKGEVLGGGHRCTNCGTSERKKTGIFGLCVAFRKGLDYDKLEPGETPFNGVCNNCMWGG